ncbi:DUF6178 family protein [Halobacteriovorax sp. HLS]|uniref:DUF6178 family protein n=1 Tax=Halobacteriovorax sp. HLS TaxID=2234000 RepID=UPI000FD88668|nr:DUF6178 family protein [Halobacteriovorax sp. HLS]
MTSDGSRLIQSILSEAESYSSLEIIESYIQQGQDLSNLPTQPLYVALKSLPTEVVASALGKFSSEQRQVFLDLDLWKKDDIDPESFHFWIETYSKVTDEKLKNEFLNSIEFSIFIKGRLSVWTFDVEDPMYPDHDNYFLTEDSLLLFEFEEDYPYVGELKQFIKDIYSEKGVEAAYQHLFMIVSDGFLSMQEDEYRFKKHRLNDLGFVDYYDALEMNNSFPSMSHVDHFIKSKVEITGELEAESLNQCLDKNAVIAFKNNFDSISDELSKLKNEKRVDFLQFNFTRLINATLTLSDALKDGSVAMTRVGRETANTIKLGLNYIKNLSEQSEQGVFSKFDFVDIYRVGRSLIYLTQKTIKKSYAQSGFNSDNDAFLGEIFSTTIENSFYGEVKYIENRIENKSTLVESYSSFLSWEKEVQLLNSTLPFIQSFYKTFQELKEAGQLMDNYYLNFDVADIDFESLILSTFINFCNKSIQENSGMKIGVTISELRDFSKRFIQQEAILQSKAIEFKNTFGLSVIDGFENYIEDIIKYHLSGYDLEELDSSEFKHVGGPLILQDQ